MFFVFFKPHSTRTVILKRETQRRGKQTEWEERGQTRTCHIIDEEDAEEEEEEEEGEGEEG